MTVAARVSEGISTRVARVTSSGPLSLRRGNFTALRLTTPQAILKRWRELSPQGSVDPVQDLSVQRLPDTAENGSYPGLGAYCLGQGVQVWITQAPNSWGWGSAPKILWVVRFLSFIKKQGDFTVTSGRNPAAS